jgi:hypothetical protein
MPENSYAVLALSFHLPGPAQDHTDCKILNGQRYLPAYLITDNNTENYNRLAAELGELLHNLHRAVRTMR